MEKGVSSTSVLVRVVFVIVLMMVLAMIAAGVLFFFTGIIPNPFAPEPVSPEPSSSVQIQVTDLPEEGLFLIKNTGREPFTDFKLSTNFQGVKCALANHPLFPGDATPCGLVRVDPAAPTKISGDEPLTFSTSELSPTTVPHGTIHLGRFKGTTANSEGTKEEEDTYDIPPAESTTSESVTIVNFPLNGNAYGYSGWGNCSSQTGDWKDVNSFCKCKGYSGAVSVENDPCYHDYKLHRMRWEVDESAGNCISEGENTFSGLALMGVKCLE